MESDIRLLYNVAATKNRDRVSYDSWEEHRTVELEDGEHIRFSDTRVSNKDDLDNRRYHIE